MFFPTPPPPPPHTHTNSVTPRLEQYRCWNGDRRLREKYGEDVFAAFEEQTSVLPFKAILEVGLGLGGGVCSAFTTTTTTTTLHIIIIIIIIIIIKSPPRQGRQQLPADYWKEFARLPYLVIGVGTLGAYLLHPFMQAGSWVVRS